MKIRRIFWGLLFLAAGILIVVHQLGYPVAGYFGELSPWGIVFSVLMIPIIVEGVAHLNFFAMLIPIGVLAIIHSELLGIEKIGAKPIILASVCLSIGLTIIFRRPVETFKRKYLSGHNCKHDTSSCEGDSVSFKESVENVESDVVNCSVRFGEATKYVKASEFKSARLSCAFGAIKMFFDGTDLSPEGAEIYVTASFSGIEIYIPKNWKVEPDVSTALSGISEKNRSVLSPDSPVLRIKGSINFSGLDLIYV